MEDLEKEIERSNKFYFVVMVFMMVALGVVGFSLVREMRVDTKRATFMLECMHMHELPADRCEEILRGEYVP